jgi:hypothetical protein
MEPVGVGGLSVFGRCSLTSPIDIGTSDWEKRPVPLRPLVEQYQDQGERDRRLPTSAFESLNHALRGRLGVSSSSTHPGPARPADNSALEQAIIAHAASGEAALYGVAP